MRGRGVEMGSIRSSRVGSRVGSRLAASRFFLSDVSSRGALIGE